VLSLAARGGGWKPDDEWAKKSSSGNGATAALTASSNKSNSTSLIALSRVESAKSQDGFVGALSGLFGF
jgi:hypothetical protein